MGFFSSKKVKKAAPEPKPVVNKRPTNPPPSQYASSTTPTPQFWPRQEHHHQHPPPPYPAIQYQAHPRRPFPQHQTPFDPHRGPYQQPIVVNQHYYITPPAPPSQPPTSTSTALILRPPSTAPQTQGCPLGLDKFTAPVANMARDFASPRFFDEPNFHPHATQLINSTASCVEEIANRFNDVMTLIDRDGLVGNEKALFTYQVPVADPAPAETQTQASHGKSSKSKNGSSKSAKKEHKDSKSRSQDVVADVVRGSYFSKVELYANSKLPVDLPPLRLYMPTWPLLCLAAQYAERVYLTPKGAERDAHVQADRRHGTKAMVIKSVPMDHMNTIVFAIRGSELNFADWAVNLRTAPASPAGFLDDAANLCHAGFLAVARRMVAPVAARLRQLLEEDPGRSAYSLLITGHSAGGAVAALLYAHMLATGRRAESELNALTGCFKRVHCVTFGTPPVTLLPLRKPEGREFRKSLFMTFANEGDPIPRADKGYFKALIEALAAPAPKVRVKKEKQKKKGEEVVERPVWEIPDCELSLPGRIVVLRNGERRARVKEKAWKTVQERLSDSVVAQTVSDEELRGVIWGDMACHLMKLYSGRIERLAVEAVTGKR
ncbi:hypothetical protein Cob_v005516 [Colletotrichum orbiculare MAFF 240422]|uniref:Fungal lipase-type domain-containing protein n=1 Tax=Colletotrichum orbiculare (strain 104-T / ATCC 96160 / CBS 514.97 / LARS 414 / MAFF 240422) TaxID=1213857 RepID=N4VJ70_COLOR|nr:hypothetical protein Cob_v005516 [Colletotrichum orbiculare MAFF 240422]